MRINMRGLRDCGFHVEIDEKKQVIEIYPEAGLHLDQDALNEVLKDCGLTLESRHRIHDRFVDIVHEEQVFDAIRESQNF